MLISALPDGAPLDVVLTAWTRSVRGMAVQAVAVLGPALDAPAGAQQVLAVHPPAAAGLAQALATEVQAPTDPLLAWDNLAEAPVSPWLAPARALGLQARLAIAQALPADVRLVAHLFSARPLEPAAAGEAAWTALQGWPAVRRQIGARQSRLSPRERACLELAFLGLTARESAQRLQCAERTVNYHLANAMAKLGADGKQAALRRACWLGAI